LYRQAAVGGISDAMNSLGLLLEDGRGCSGQRPNPYEAASWYLQSCKGRNGGIHEAAVNLALLLLSGTVEEFCSLDGEEFSVVDATEWLRRYSREIDLASEIRKQLDAILRQLG
jgi:TPR repeat protein